MKFLYAKFGKDWYNYTYKVRRGNVQYFRMKKKFEQSGVRTHASEETAALTLLLRPLDHLSTQGSRM